MICPCCGQAVSPKSRLQALAASQPVVRRAVLDALLQARRPLPAADLAARVYTGPDGGPDHATAVLRVHVSKLRDALRPEGWDIHCERNVGYALVERAA